MTRADRIAALNEALQSRILVLDGAMGTALQERQLSAEDFGGQALEGCNEVLVLTRPDVVRDIHRSYLEAGADILETNTFGGTPLVLAEYGLAERAREINAVAARLARATADEHATPARPRWVAGSMGPTTKAISVTGGVTFEELVHHYHVQALGLYEGGADFLLLETCQDTRNVKAGLLAIEKVFEEVGARIPVAVSGTIERMGTMLAGQSVEALTTSLEHFDLLYIGLNCATGPAFMTDHIRSLSALARTRVACVPNAGLPDEHGRYLETPSMIAKVLRRFAEEGWLNLVGGCCGTTPAHIAALAAFAREMRPRVPPTARRSTLSGVDYLEVASDNRPLLVGERTNVIGSKKFKELICAEKFEEAAEIARAQVKNMAAVIDICLANPDRNELEDMRRFLEVLVKKVRVPLMIDSTDAAVIDLALTYSQGKAIINSVNLEDGEERFEKVVPLARRYGAALVVGCIDERGMAVSRERKLEVARRCHEILTRRYGVPEEDLYFDPLVFPCATGDAQYVGSAVETIEGVRLIHEAFPRSKTILGISNVSFGLPAAGREVLNSVFLYHCVQAGLDLAIVNSEKLVRYPSIPDEEKHLAEDLLYNRGNDPIAAFAAHFRERRPAAAPRSTLPLDERLARYIVEGTRDGLFEDLRKKLEEAPPLAIINGPLMRGMDEVGRLFNENKLIVAEVLQSAEAMKAAVSFLEPFMDRVDTAQRGKVILATVKGDVHDIGKNLVDIILTNNGFQVVNLGIKVPPADLIAAVREHRPDILGLSGLLVKSAQQMVVTVQDLSRAGVDVPILVGGAALTRNFVNREIAPSYEGTVAYAKDAMTGLDLAKQIVEPERHAKLREALRSEREKAALAPAASAVPAPRPGRKRAARLLDAVPSPPDWDRHVLTRTPLDQIWGFVNPMMLYGRHLGLKGRIVHEVEKAPAAELARTETGRKALELREAVEAVKAECRAGLMKARAVYQFFRAAGDGDDLVLFDPAGGRKLARFTFPRQAKEPGLCLSDYVAPSAASLADNVCLFVTTCGEGIREAAERHKAAGDYLRSHILQALALESAEAYAEMLHLQIRSMWGFPDGPEVTMKDRFQARYRGKRFSFGYPACPRLEDQAILFSVLRPEEIGVSLTEEFMMEPEASVSAIVFHHPDAVYYSVLESGGEAAA
jgi:5-methyltetrahydrofolate--homocysteine methyltransferase